MSNEVLHLIETKASLRAKCLAEEKRLEIDGYMNEILYQQSKKLRYLTDFVKEFHEVNEI